MKVELDHCVVSLSFPVNHVTENFMNFSSYNIPPTILQAFKKTATPIIKCRENW